MNEAQRAEVARILEIVARDGLPGPRDLDVALDAIECAMNPVFVLLDLVDFEGSSFEGVFSTEELANEHWERLVADELTAGSKQLKEVKIDAPST